MAIASPKTRRGETSRAAILSAALDLFQERGYEATTMRSIAEDLAARLRGTMRSVVVTCEPFHAVAGSIFSTVANPSSPLNPFGAAAKPLRDEVVALYAEVVRGSDARIPADIAEMLPLTLWLYQMGILYFWIRGSRK